MNSHASRALFFGTGRNNCPHSEHSQNCSSPGSTIRCGSGSVILLHQSLLVAQVDKSTNYRVGCVDESGRPFDICIP
jgi:hypothetical protein